MTPQFALVGLMLVWILLPLALFAPLRRTGCQPPARPLVATAGIASFLFARNATGPLLLHTAQPAAGPVPYHDTYYIVAHHQRLELVAFLMLGLGGLALIAQGLYAGRRLARAALAGHWSAHFGAALLALPFLPLAPMPRRYVDYADTFFWWTIATNAGLVLALAGAALVLATILPGLVRRPGAR